MNQSYEEINQRSIQENIYLITNGVTTITNSIISGYISLASDLVLLLTLIAGLVYVDFKVALITVVIFGLISLVLYKLTHVRANSLGKKQMQFTIKSIEMIHEILGSFKEVSISGRRAYYSREIGKSQNALARNQAELSFLPTINKYVLEVTVVMGFLIISAVTFSSNSASRSIAIISIFLAASTRIAPAVLRLQQVAVTIKTASASAISTLDLIEKFTLDSEPNGVVKRFSNTHAGFKASVEIKNLSFTYLGNKNATLKNINFEIESGQVVAIVGKSGAGKTTLADLIIGVLTPDFGSVKISNLNASEISLHYPGAVAYVPQEVFISNGTIKSNVSLGFSPEEIPDNHIWESLKSAELLEFVRGLPNKLNYLIGDRGSKLSGGQRQRLGIARALITKPKVIILDEATSSLDSETEQNIAETILKLSGSATVIIIAHRLSTVKNADKVVYLENGEVKSIGKFNKVRNEVPDFDKQAKLFGI